MNPFYILICCPAIILMLLVAYLVTWVATAPRKAVQNVQNRKSS